MLGKLSKIGLALIAIAALGALSAAPASATTKFHFEEEETYFDPVNESLLGFNYGKVLCTTQTLAGVVLTPGKQTPESFGVTPTYVCGGPGGTTATFSMNKCEYLLVSGKTDAALNYEGGVIVYCPPTGGVIEIKFTVVGQLKCTITIDVQGPLGKVTYINANVGKGKERGIVMDMDLTGITYTQDAGAGLGACKSEAAANGTYESTTNLYGLNKKGERIGNWIE